VVFERQSRRLEAEIRAALDLAAVLGRRLTEVALYAAIDLSPGQAAEALSRLRDEGYLREVRGDLEFRNELIRAQAYYSVAATTRLHLHRQVAALLEKHHSQKDKAIWLEIAWHYLRGADVERAYPFAIEGAEAVLAVGAPHGAEEILTSISHLDPHLQQAKKLRLLLARALIDQSKAEPALSIIEKLAVEGMSLYEQAEVAMIRAAAEFGLNRERGTKYHQIARIALESAQSTGDHQLISRALFECARAATEEGLIELVQAAENGIDELAAATNGRLLPMVVLTKAFCRVFFWNHSATAENLESFLQSKTNGANSAELGLLYSGLGIAKYFLGQFSDAHAAFLRSLEFAYKVGDDHRVSQVTSNLCALQMTQGFYQNAIVWGERSISAGEACSSPTLLTSYTNLMDPYLLTGRNDDALRCLESARRWLIPERRWKLHCAFLSEAASFALSQRNQALSLDLVSQLEVVCRGREQAVPMPGPYWKLIIFKESLIADPRRAYDLAKTVFDRFYSVCPFHCLDIAAVMSWLERRMGEGITEQTNSRLGLFDSFGAHGKRALLTLQGFLTPNPQADSVNEQGGLANARRRQERQRI